MLPLSMSAMSKNLLLKAHFDILHNNHYLDFVGNVVGTEVFLFVMIMLCVNVSFCSAAVRVSLLFDTISLPNI